MSARHHLSAAEIDGLQETSYVHPLNANAVRLTRTLGEIAGLRNVGVHLVRVAPGRASTEFHFHHAEEEFLYVLAGRGVAEIDGREIPVGPGDFMGFPAGGPAHAMRNEGDEDLVYLMAGERRDGDVVDYPRAGKRALKALGNRHIVDYPKSAAAGGAR